MNLEISRIIKRLENEIMDYLETIERLETTIKMNKSSIVSYRKSIISKQSLIKKLKEVFSE